MRYKELKSFIIVFLGLFCLINGHFAQAQDEEYPIIQQVEEALKSASSKELSKYLHTKVEIKLNNNRKEYSINQAEIMLKEFFQEHPSESFKFIHSGNSSGGIVYAIGEYQTGNTEYRVVVRTRSYSGNYKVYRLEFTEAR